MKGHGAKAGQWEPKKAFMVLPYMKGVTEMLQRAYKQYSIQLFWQARYTIRNAVEGPSRLRRKMRCDIYV